MSLDEELRATLGLEAELRTAPPPDVTGLIHRGRARRRRRTLRRAGVAAVAVVAFAATAFGVVTLDPRADGELASNPSPSPRADLETRSEDGRATLAPGTYGMFVGHDAAGAPIGVDVTVGGPHWEHGDFPIVSEQGETTYAGFGVYQPRSLASGNGCETGPTLGPLARTRSGLAAQLADLPRSTVLLAPERARVVGLAAIHLRLRIEVDCPGYYRVAHATGGTRGITYSPPGLPHPDVVIDFWVIDVNGAVVVIDEWHNTDAPADVVAQARDARRSITFKG
ncbi:hypothetical protein IEZ26_04635 [Nocardioides cavernae]|uniref:Uncharacterized protein n=1 Tax=Nocardioides cavernae TaxID=1921566 RepID=A0ABR8NBS6_9ACTN|nr:hypothetical protein [Nocardioides cavernae]MBD3923899.1 hypothetical protein [Nocardioides cavernae]MBM7511165.1 hypothetical protein [Nocardioides cavernae]